MDGLFGAITAVPGPIAGAGLPGLIPRAVAFSAGGDGVRKSPDISRPLCCASAMTAALAKGLALIRCTVPRSPKAVCAHRSRQCSSAPDEGVGLSRGGAKRARHSNPCASREPRSNYQTAAGECSEHCCRNRLGVDQRHTAKERGEQRKQHQLTYSRVHAVMVARCRRRVKERGRAPDRLMRADRWSSVTALKLAPGLSQPKQADKEGMPLVSF